MGIKILPLRLLGVMSPYPTVVSVMTVKYRESKNVPVEQVQLQSQLSRPKTFQNVMFRIVRNKTKPPAVRARIEILVPEPVVFSHNQH